MDPRLTRFSFPDKVGYQLASFESDDQVERILWFGMVLPLNVLVLVPDMRRVTPECMRCPIQTKESASGKLG
jgi:hypothetical protein